MDYNKAVFWDRDGILNQIEVKELNTKRGYISEHIELYLNQNHRLS